MSRDALVLTLIGLVLIAIGAFTAYHAAPGIIGKVLLAMLCWFMAAAVFMLAALYWRE